MIATRPTTAQHLLPDDTYVYDPNGNVKQITDNATGRMNRGNRTMTYDGLDRLKTAVSPMWGGGTASYAYDALDNLTRVVVPGSRNHYYCYDGANLLTNDPQGNVSNKSGTLYDFDFGNRLRGVYTLAGATIETYRYDGLGRRVLAWAPGTGNVLSQYSQGGQLVYQHDYRTQQRIDYLYLGGSLVASRTRPFGSSIATIEYQHTDGLGSPVATSDATGSRLRYDDYEPYGRRMNRANDNRPGHTGHVMDQNTGLTYMQQRYYDPGIGMFLSVDPVTAYSNPIVQFHRYRYANNNPYKFTDPDGRLAVDEDAPPPPPEPTTLETVPVAAPPPPVTLATVTVTAQRIGQVGRTITAPLWISATAGAGVAAPFLFLYSPHPCGGAPCGELTMESRKFPRGYWPGPAGAREWGKRNGVNPEEAARRFHRGVKGNTPGAKADHDYGVNPDTGDVVDPNGDSVGDLHDAQG